MEEPLQSDSQIPNSASPARGTALAIASLVLGIIACVSSLFVVGAFFGLIGIGLGLAHILGKRGPNGMAWWGVGLSLFGILAGVAMGVFIYKFIVTQKDKFAASDNSFNSWIGVPAPDIVITTLDGKTTRLSELRGKRVVLDFWATWCGPCTMEMPHFTRLYNESSRGDLAIIGISNENEGTVRSFVSTKNVAYPIAVSGDLPSPYRDVTGIPTTFFIDRNGIVQSVLVGYRDFNELKSRALAEDFKQPAKVAPEQAPQLPVQVEAGKNSSQPSDPWIGTWKLNPAKSRMTALAGNISDVLVTCRELNRESLELTATQTRKDGSKVTVWQCTVPKSGGIQNYSQGSPGEGVSVVKTVIDAHTHHLTYLRDGKQLDLGTIVLSHDGRAYTISQKYWDSDGKPQDQVEVYEKQ